MAQPLPLPHGSALCRHPTLGLCRAWTEPRGDEDGLLHLDWSTGHAELPGLPGLRCASLAPWGDDLLVALSSQRSDVSERVLRHCPESGTWEGVATLSSFGALRWALPLDEDAVLIGGEQLYRLREGEVELLGHADRQAVALPTGEVCTVRWDADSGLRRLVVVYGAGEPLLPDAPAAAWEHLFEADGRVFWLAQEGLCSWSPEVGARLEHPDPGPLVHGVWVTSSGRLLWLSPEHTRGGAELLAADGACLALPPGHTPLWPTDEHGRRWAMRRAREHIPQGTDLEEVGGFGALLRATVQGDDLVEVGLFLPPPRQPAPEPRPVRGPAPLRERSVTWLEVHPAVHAALAELGVQTVGQLAAVEREAVVAGVLAQGLEERLAQLTVRDLAAILADLGLSMR